jgi:hypothetical protein
VYLGESPFDRDEFAVRAGCHVAAGQLGGRPSGQARTPAPDAGKSAFPGLGDYVSGPAIRHGMLASARLSRLRQGRAGFRRLHRGQVPGSCRSPGLLVTGAGMCSCCGGGCLDPGRGYWLRLARARPRWLASCIARIPGGCAVVSLPVETSPRTAGISAAAGSAVVVAAPWAGALRRGQTIPQRVIATLIAPHDRRGCPAGYHPRRAARPGAVAATL